MEVNNVIIDQSKVLDVTKLEPRFKHSTIFEYFDRLRPGESFIIHNDHDPKPLYYQLLGERGTIFTFDYLEAGPTVWHIEIKLNEVDNATNEITVGEIVTKDYRKAEAFKKMGIDFCCHGSKTLKEASAEVGIPVEEIEKAIAEIGNATESPAHDYNSWDIDFLADYIVNTHHKYVKTNAEILNNIAQKVAEHHHVNHPELPELAVRVNHHLQDLINHMHKEEKVLFPAIKALVAHQRDPQNNPLKIGMVAGAVKILEMEHEEAGDDTRTFRDMTNDYQLPEDACNSYQYLFEKLKEYENDLFNHIHLENNILFPKAEKLEIELFNR